jgi:hypothetical protein
MGQVYVNDNTRGVNTVGAFDRHADGTLTPMRGSPFAASAVGRGDSTGDLLGATSALPEALRAGRRT